MQYRSPVAGGPSGNTCPKCDSHFLHITSVLIIPQELSTNSVMLLFDEG